MMTNWRRGRYPKLWHQQDSSLSVSRPDELWEADQAGEKPTL